MEISIIILLVFLILRKQVFQIKDTLSNHIAVEVKRSEKEAIEELKKIKQERIAKELYGTVEDMLDELDNLQDPNKSKPKK